MMNVIERLTSIIIVIFIIIAGLFLTAMNRINKSFEKILREDFGEKSKFGGSDYISFKDAMNLEYPYCKLFKTDDDASRALAEINDYKLEIANADFVIPMLDLAGDQLHYDGKPAVILMTRDSRDSISWLSDYFNEDCRIDCKRYNERLTSREFWAKNKKQIYNKCKNMLGTTSVKGLADTMYPMHYGCTTFRPELVSGFIKLFGAKSMLDISAGWGDRLLGCIATGIRYVGVDPNTRLHEGYQRAIDMFAKKASDYTLICSPFQTAELPDETFDMVFTSPPYFDVERYSDEETQSINEFKSVDEWFNGFLAPSLTRAWAKLNVGGHMVLHINNTPGKPDYVVRMRDFINTFNGAVYKGIMGKVHIDSRDKPYKARPVWIWRKDNVPLETTGAEDVTIGEINTNITTTSTLTIVPLSREYVDDLAEITLETNTMAQIADTKPWSRDKILKLIEYAEADAKLPISMRKYTHWIILLDKIPIGYISVYPLDNLGPQIRIFISEKYTRRGFGRRGLTTALIEYVTARQLDPTTKIYYQSRVDNKPSQKLAASIGFVEQPGVFHIGGTPLIRQSITVADIIKKLHNKIM